MDRFTILTLKLQAYLRNGRDIEQLQNELDMCEKFLEAGDMRHPYAAEDHRKLALELLEVNKRLWSLEDTIRQKMKDREDYQNSAQSVDPSKSMAFIACEIVRSNDLRSALIGEINKLYKLKPEEKIYEST